MARIQPLKRRSRGPSHLASWLTSRFWDETSLSRISLTIKDIPVVMTIVGGKIQYSAVVGGKAEN